MSYRNEILLSGRSLSDATQLSSRTPYKITLTQGGNKKTDSDERWPTSYYTVICWPDKCDGPAAEVKKGDFVEVTGRIQQRSWKDRDNATRSTVEIIAATLLIQPKQQKPPITPNLHGLEITDADIPF